MKTKILHFWLFLLIAVLLLSYSQLAAGEEFKTIIGPRNVDLADGADALLMGRGEEGVRLTLRGLEIATGDRERKIAHSNLCAGYIMIDKPLTALEHCNWVVDRYPDFWRAYNNRALVYLRLERFEESEADIRRGQELNPNSTKLKIAKGMLLDETNPVIPNVELDERRNAMDDGSEGDTRD